MSVKDWVLSQLLSNSLATSRPLSANDSLLSEGHLDEEFRSEGIHVIISLSSTCSDASTSCMSKIFRRSPC